MFAVSSSVIASTKSSTRVRTSAAMLSMPAASTSVRWRSAAGSSSVFAIEAPVSASMFARNVYCSSHTS